MCLLKHQNWSPGWKDRGSKATNVNRDFCIFKTLWPLDFQDKFKPSSFIRNLPKLHILFTTWLSLVVAFYCIQFVESGEELEARRHPMSIVNSVQIRFFDQWTFRLSRKLLTKWKCYRLQSRCKCRCGILLHQIWSIGWRNRGQKAIDINLFKTFHFLANISFSSLHYLLVK